MIHENDMNNIPPTLQDDDKSDKKEIVTWRQLLFGAFNYDGLAGSGFIWLFGTTKLVDGLDLHRNDNRFFDGKQDHHVPEVPGLDWIYKPSEILQG